MTLICASVDMFADPAFANPLLDYILPRFFAGYAHNALTTIGIKGWPSLLGLAAFWAAAVIAGRSRAVAR